MSRRLSGRERARPVRSGTMVLVVFASDGRARGCLSELALLWAASSWADVEIFTFVTTFLGTAKVRFRRVALRAANQSQLSRPRRAHSACLRECRERPVSCRLAPLTKSVLNQGAVASIKDCPKIQRSVELIRNIPKMAAHLARRELGPES